MIKNEEARDLLIKYFENKRFDLPDDVDFILEENETQCRIKLDPKKVQTENMQIDANAFEAWALALHVAMEKPGKIILDFARQFENIAYEKNGHWGRFLYRALRFSRQYGDWFELSGQIKAVVGEFEKYLDDNCFTNNLGKGEAGVKEKHGEESAVEAEFAKNGMLKQILDDVDEIGNNEVFRQLPVGLFRTTADKPYDYFNETRVFTGGKSAIDLWTWKEGIFDVIELKTNFPMAGIITEIFFYSNYMYDFLIREKSDGKGFRLNPNRVKGNDRGYSNILENESKFKEICGIMLTDKYHPILEDEAVLEMLNRNGNVRIRYIKTYYEYTPGISKKIGK